MKSIHKNKTQTLVLDCAIEVHKQLGAGLVDSVYKKCFCKELELNNIPYLYSVPIDVKYKNFEIDEFLDVDILVNNEIAVEIYNSEHDLALKMARINTILKFSNYKIGILINFNLTNLMDGYKKIGKI